MDNHPNVQRLAVALLIALLALCPQAGYAAAQEEDSVRLAFELYLSGDVPEGEQFRLVLMILPPGWAASRLPTCTCAAGRGRKSKRRRDPR